jgi:hypothetical protein
MADYPLTQAGWEQIENASALWDYTQARIKTADPNKPIDIREIYQNGKQVANKEDLDANTAQINLNQTEIATNKSDITALEGEVNANASQIQINANSIANLDTRVTTNTNNIASLQSQVTALNASSLSDVASNDSLNGDGRAIDPLSLNLANPNIWTATQTFSKAKVTNPFAENASGSTNKVTSLDQDGEITVSNDLTIGDLFTAKTKADANESNITALDARVTTIESNEANFAKLDQVNIFSEQNDFERIGTKILAAYQGGNSFDFFVNNTYGEMYWNTSTPEGAGSSVSKLFIGSGQGLSNYRVSLNVGSLNLNNMKVGTGVPVLIDGQGNLVKGS